VAATLLGCSPVSQGVLRPQARRLRDLLTVAALVVDRPETLHATIITMMMIETL
jgi:hypothetical protein